MDRVIAMLVRPPTAAQSGRRKSGKRSRRPIGAEEHQQQRPELPGKEEQSRDPQDNQDPANEDMVTLVLAGFPPCQAAGQLSRISTKLISQALVW